MKSNYFKKITYTDKTQTPLLWHDYNRFFRIPCSILGLRNRLRELNAPGLREIVNKFSEHINLCEYEIKVYQIRLKMNELYDSIKDDSPFGKTYTEADEMIKKLEKR